MKKFKYLLILSLIALLAVGVLMGCTPVVGIDPEVTPHKITYCANGGELKGKTERYVYVGNNVHAPEPKAGSSIIVQATRSGYKFLGWAKGKVDAEGNPVLLDNAIDATDGGVWMTFEGAVSEDLTVNYDEVTKQYYDYDRNNLWVFNKDRITEDTVLVAVWGEYNKFIIAGKDENTEDGWEDLSPVLDDSFSIGSDVYEQYKDRLRNVENSNGTEIEQYEVANAYAEDRENHTALKFYEDKELEHEITFPYKVDDAVTVIYYEEIEGIYDIVTTYNALQSAVTGGRNVYLDADIDMTDRTVTMNGDNVKYSGTILGNGHTVSGVSAEVYQYSHAIDTPNIYGGLFGDLIGATISNLTVEMKLNFVIATDPDGVDSKTGNRTGTDNDRECYVGAFARSMKNCKLENVNVKAVYEVTRSQIDKGIQKNEKGEYETIYEDNNFDVNVTVNEWQAQESSDNSLIGCSIELKEKSEVPEEDKGNESGDDQGDDDQESDDDNQTDDNQGQESDQDSSDSDNDAQNQD